MFSITCSGFQRVCSFLSTFGGCHTLKMCRNRWKHGITVQPPPSSRHPAFMETELTIEISEIEPNRFGWQVHIYPLSGGSLTHLTLLTQGFGLSIPYRYVWLNHFVAESTILRHVLHLSLNRTPIPNKKPSPCGYLGTIPAPKGPT